MDQPKKFDPARIDSSPCPYFLSQLKFTVFKRLPLEMQVKIWKFALPEGKIVTINKQFVLSGTVPNRIPLPVEDKASGLNIDLGFQVTVKSRVYFPPMLHACHISRAVTLKTLSQVFAAQLGNPIFFNFKKDILHLNSSMAMEIFEKFTPPSGPSQLHLGCVKRLVLTFSAGPTEHEFAKILATFPKLEEVYIVLTAAELKVIHAEPDDKDNIPLDGFKPLVLSERAKMGLAYEEWTPPTYQIIDKPAIDDLINKDIVPAAVKYYS
jgi:hypothetical protein